jgi:plastocyanin
MKKKIVYIALILVSCAMLIYSCSKGYNSSSPTYVPPGTGTGVTASVSIQNMAFTPDTLKVKTGTTVTWTNMDSVPHTVTELDGIFSSGNIAAGQTYNYMFGAVGSYTYHCTIHPMMKSAVVIVTN